MSAYFKKNATYGVRFFAFGSSNANTFFDLNNGLVVNQNDTIDASIEPVGTDWFRCSMTFDQTNTRCDFYVTNNAQVQVLGEFTIQDAQLEIGLAATDYIESGASTGKAGLLEDEPRFDYSGGATCPSLLLEPSRTNIVPISEGIPEDTNGVTLTENYGTSPEGLQNSLKVQKDGVSSNDRIFPIDNYNATLVSGTSYSLSAFVKNIDVNGTTTIGCRLGSGGTLFRLGYEWNGSSLTKSTLYAAGTRTNEILEDYGNGWWRIGFSFVADNTQGGIELDIDRQNGSATTSLETYGWQLEAGSYPTSYIPNHSGGSVTRGVEVTSKMTLPTSLGTDFTIYFDTKIFDSGNGMLIFEDASNNDIYKFYSYSDHYDVYDVTAGQFLVKTTAPANGKIALKQSGSSIKIFINGQDETKTGAVGNTTEIAKFEINQTSVQQNRCTLNQILLFTEALSDADCITLTT